MKIGEQSANTAVDEWLLKWIVCVYVCIRRPMMIRNIVDYENCADTVSADEVKLPPVTALLATNHAEQLHSRPIAVALSQRNTNPPSLPTSPVRVNAPAAANLSSPTDSYDSTFGKVRMYVITSLSLSLFQRPFFQVDLG